MGSSKHQCNSRNPPFFETSAGSTVDSLVLGKRKQSFLRNHAIPPCTFLTPVGNRCITPCVCVKEPSRSRGVLPTAGGLSVHTGTVCCRNIRRHIQRYWIWRRLCRSLSCSAARGRHVSVSCLFRGVRHAED